MATLKGWGHGRGRGHKEDKRSAEWAWLPWRAGPQREGRGFTEEDYHEGWKRKKAASLGRGAWLPGEGVATAEGRGHNKAKCLRWAWLLGGAEPQSGSDLKEAGCLGAWPMRMGGAQGSLTVSAERAGNPANGEE